MKIFRLMIIILSVFLINGCAERQNSKAKTHVSIQNTKWYFNNQIINPGSPAEGLLMNVRMVNAVFEDRGEEISKFVSNFDPEANASAFIQKIPEYVSSGVNAFTISLQGGLPGYEGAINTAFNSDGSLRPEYLQRVERVIRECDANNAVIILSCFYQRQHSHSSALTGKETIMKALENTVNWIKEKKFTNVMLEVSNEYRHGGYRNWPDGEWLISEEGQVEMIRRAKEIYPELLVSTSGMGNGLFHHLLAEASDFLLIHFNNTSLEDIPTRINDLKKYNKPIVCNEDDKLKQEGAAALALSVMNGSAWGLMHAPRNQRVPFEFLGTADDPEVYQMYRNVATPGYKIDPESLKQTSITIIDPNDGDGFRLGQPISIRLSHMYPDKSIQSKIEIYANEVLIATPENRLQVNWQPEAPGIYNFEARVKDLKGNILYRSSKVDIIVKENN